MDHEDEFRPPASGQHPRESAYCGIASIAIAGILLLMAVPALSLAFWLEMGGYRGMSASDKRIAAYGGYIGAIVVELLAFTSVGIAIRGLGAASRTHEPRVLCLAGLLLGLFAIALWFMCGFAWHSQAARFI